MIRKIISIDASRCNGCGLCAAACHEGAIAMVEGKARLLRDDYCDGLGDCLPACPTGAITFVEREAAAYDEAAVQKRKTVNRRSGGCPGARAHLLEKGEGGRIGGQAASQLRQWPVQIKLAPLAAPCFDGAHLLIAADCTAYAYGSFHEDFIRGKTVLIGCPKLDQGDYAEKLAGIIGGNAIESITVARMQVPCCGGLERAVADALEQSGKNIPLEVVTISIDGYIVE